MHTTLTVQHISKFLQHPLARARIVPSNQIADRFEICSLIGSHGWHHCNQSCKN